jgi:hypothetical protein
MSFTKIESEKVGVPHSAEKLFNYLTDFNNFQKLMPPQVTNWVSTNDDCSFTINGMATIGMKIIEKFPFEKIVISSNGKVPFDFKLFVNIVATSESSCDGQLIFESEMNAMMKMMVEKPLGNFFNLLAQKIKDIQL